ncbi:DUF3422 domain-containing protein [Sphingomonas sp. SUN019]|uniref:DUF3422 family protein n=1 Tax=Sphingomonas sp. SUN019 TaxID=2937788 RepID=UPI002164EB70|nr:DUF3422 domain-containing protein [Sphingomonas sp. SUN019]UVO50833.1 DUF3422 domain-containing protein [Sphingomonas sp. SUN019]
MTAGAQPHRLSIPSHRLRAALSAEMHVRRLPRFSSPCRLMQVVTLLGDGAAAASRTAIVEIAVAHGVTLPADARYAVIPLNGLTLVWEGHTEFASYTLIRGGQFDAPFDPGDFAGADHLIAAFPGEVIRATQIAVTSQDSALPDRAALEAMFEATALIVCDVAGGRARAMSDFTLHPDGYGRLLVADRGLEGDETAQLVQRLQELGNYRNMALLGLPTAQTATPEVSRLEQRLSTLTHAVSEPGTDDAALLDELTFVSAELARIAAATRYRMTATRAYATLSTERLASLEIGAVRGYQTLADFTERRLVPAVRTCDSFSARIDDLSQRAAWASSLLRTRIDIALARQNRDLLESMDRRTGVQLRLQQAVEGLSVVAISYYLVALIAYVVKATPGARHDLVVAGAVPLVLFAVWLAVRRFQRALHD